MLKNSVIVLLLFFTCFGSSAQIKMIEGVGNKADIHNDGFDVLGFKEGRLVVLNKKKNSNDLTYFLQLYNQADSFKLIKEARIEIDIESIGVNFNLNSINYIDNKIYVVVSGKLQKETTKFCYAAVFGSDLQIISGWKKIFTFSGTSSNIDSMGVLWCNYLWQDSVFRLGINSYDKSKGRIINKLQHLNLNFDTIEYDHANWLTGIEPDHENNDDDEHETRFTTYSSSEGKKLVLFLYELNKKGIHAYYLKSIYFSLLESSFDESPLYDGKICDLPPDDIKGIGGKYDSLGNNILTYGLYDEGIFFVKYNVSGGRIVFENFDAYAESIKKGNKKSKYLKYRKKVSDFPSYFEFLHTGKGDDLIMTNNFTYAGDFDSNGYVTTFMFGDIYGSLFDSDGQHLGSFFSPAFIVDEINFKSYNVFNKPVVLKNNNKTYIVIPDKKENYNSDGSFIADNVYNNKDSRNRVLSAIEVNNNDAGIIRRPLDITGKYNVNLFSATVFKISENQYVWFELQDDKAKIITLLLE